jgi:sugar lactone lactonase YvrE
MITRGMARVLVYERDGTFLRSWGERQFTERTHGITVTSDGAVFCVDDAGHDVRKYTPDGQLLMRLGTGRASDTRYDGKVMASIRGGPPFNRPTNLAVAPDGELFITDGYGNARVHVFSADGRLLRSWGEPGTGPGQFMLPHGLAVLRDGRVAVATARTTAVNYSIALGNIWTAGTHRGRRISLRDPMAWSTSRISGGARDSARSDLE